MLKNSVVLQGIYIPGMLEDLTTQRVLTMEWVDGVRLRSAGEDPSVGRALDPQDMKLVGVRLVTTLSFSSPVSSDPALQWACLTRHHVAAVWSPVQLGADAGGRILPCRP